MREVILTTHLELESLIRNSVQLELQEQLKPLIQTLSQDRIDKSRRVGRREAARIEGISISMLDKLCVQGKYHRIKVGNKTLFDLDENGRVL